jgi:uncharacterized membrane protein HdeD (DUF308 family)
MMVQTAEDSESVEANSVSRTWRALLVVGLLLAVLGVLATIFPFATGIGVELFFGSLLIVGGIAQGWHAFYERQWTGFLGEIVLSVLYLITGVLLLANPVFGLAALTLLVGLFSLVEGLVELYMGFRVRPETNWIGLLISGVLSLVLAGLPNPQATHRFGALRRSHLSVC